MSDGIAELAGQLTLVLNRFSVPEKLKSCRSCDIVLLNVVAFCNAEGSQEGSLVSALLCGVGLEKGTREC